MWKLYQWKYRVYASRQEIVFLYIYKLIIQKKADSYALLQDVLFSMAFDLHAKDGGNIRIPR